MQPPFQSYLSAGDVLTINYTASGPSTFTFTTHKPAAPPGVTATPAMSAVSATYNDAGKPGSFSALTGGHRRHDV
ncbi:MAG: hypothetical protein ACTHJH_04040 [Marmoricola sp.]